MAVTRLLLTGLLVCPLTLASSSTVIGQTEAQARKSAESRTTNADEATQQGAEANSQADRTQAAANQTKRVYYDNASPDSIDNQVQRPSSSERLRRSSGEYYDAQNPRRTQANSFRRPSHDHFYNNPNDYFDNARSPYDQGRYAADRYHNSRQSDEWVETDRRSRYRNYHDELPTSDNYLERSSMVGYPNYDAPYQGYPGYAYPGYGYPTYGYPNFGYPATRYDDDLDFYSDRWWDW